MPRISSGLNGSPVLVDGRTWTPAVPAPAPGVAVGTEGATVGADGAAVGAEGATVGVAVAPGASVGATVAEGATVNGGRVAGIGATDVAHVVGRMIVSEINVTLPVLASSLPCTV